ncbi:hypothetical protein ACFXPV_18915 [Streptomyces sp. NPDC059118]|uniref:hypothetical protein n=1 Tax=unclassified Streptomyces TaxID=2593676 RepID=UPI00369FE72F
MPKGGEVTPEGCPGRLFRDCGPVTVPTAEAKGKEITEQAGASRALGSDLAHSDAV